MSQPWYKPAEAATILKTTPARINAMCKAGDFRPDHLFRIGNEWRISPAAFESAAPPVGAPAPDDVTLARIRRQTEAVQQELDGLKQIMQKWGGVA